MIYSMTAMPDFVVHSWSSNCSSTLQQRFRGHPCLLFLLVTSNRVDVTAEAAIDGFLELAMNFAPRCCCPCKARFEPTISTHDSRASHDFSST